MANPRDYICYDRCTYVAFRLIWLAGKNIGTSRRARTLTTTVHGILSFVVDLPFRSILLCTCFTAMINFYVLACSDIVRDIKVQ